MSGVGSSTSNAEWSGDYFFFWLALLVAFFAALAWWKRIYPHTALLVIVAIPTLMTIGLYFRPDLSSIVLLADLAVIVVVLSDLISLPTRRAFSVQREMLQVASIQKSHRITLTVNNQTSRNRLVWVRDDVPQDFVVTPSEMLVMMRPRSRATLRYDAQAMRRGAFQMERVFLRVRSRFGFWMRYLSYELPAKINVYPDMRQLSEYAILARTNRLSMMGVRRTRRVGQDNEFERLRDYTPDDNYKHLDWRATARRNKLTVKDFQVNQSQRIIFLLDCGRMMTNISAGISLLDHALNSMLMLSYVALRQGDSAGLVCFSDEIHSFVPPRGGMRQMNQLIHASFDRFPRLVESRYDQAFLHLSSRCKKRSLVILVTNLIDEVNSKQIHQYLSTMVGRHLPLAVLLKDHQLFNAVEDTNPTGSNLFRTAAAADMITWRHQVLTDLTHRGVLCLDVFPEQMTAPLVNQYLEIKGATSPMNDPQIRSPWRDQWDLRSDTTYLNHGSFGPPPRVVRQRQAEWRQQLDEQPMDFFVRALEPAWLEARGKLAKFVGSSPDSLAFVENATYGMNVVAHSLPLAPGDEVLLNNHEYGAVKRIWERSCSAVGARVVFAQLPWPMEDADHIVDTLFRYVNDRTKLIVVSHVTSPTAVTMPVASITRRARMNGVATCVDGPHAPAYLPLNVESLDCDFYVASCHKWLSAPFGSGFIYVAPAHQERIRTPLLSWGRLLPKKPERWYEELLWSGTRDPSPYLTIPTAIEFLCQSGLDHFRATTHALARAARHQISELTGFPAMTPDSESWYGSMAHVPLPAGDSQSLQDTLWRQFGIEVPIVEWNGGRYIRVSFHLYNDQSDLNKLLTALRKLL